MSRRHHHHHMQPYDYDRFNERDRDRDRDRDRVQTRGIEYQDDSLSSINSEEDSYLHHQHPGKEKKSNFYNTKTESTSMKPTKMDKSNDTYHQEVKKPSQYTAPGHNDATLERLTRLEGMIEQLVKRSTHAESPASSSVPEKTPQGEKRGHHTLEPRRHNFTTSMWINKIQEVSNQNNWDEKTTIAYMENQMTGLIKAWYKTLSNRDYTWPEWKIHITNMFPDNVDFITSLKRLVTRLKQPDESITTYYFSKMYLIEACKITGEDAVSCLIDGLNNQTFQEQAKAMNFLTPETLYSQFLTKLPEYTVDYCPTTPPERVTNDWYYQSQEENVQQEAPPPEVELYEYENDPRNEEFDFRSQATQNFRENDVDPRPAKTHRKRTAPVHSRLDKRFIKTPLAAKTCNICMQRGHLARNCRNVDKMMYCKGQRQHASPFFKICTIRGYKLKGLIDTGCTTVTLKRDLARSLKLTVTPRNDHLEVYGGGTVPILGDTEIPLEVDSVKARVRAVVVADHMQEVDVVVGQPFLNQKNVCVVLENDTLKFSKRP